MRGRVMSGRSPWKPLRKVYTVGGQGMAIVIDDDLPAFFQRVGQGEYTFVEGKPNLDLDGGAHAEEPQFLSRIILMRWASEGRITNEEAYKSRLYRAFRS